MAGDRRNLTVLRAKHGLTRAKMADKIGVSRSTYSEIENGKRECSLSFLNKLQATFDIPDSDMWELTKVFDDKKEV